MLLMGVAGGLILHGYLKQKSQKPGRTGLVLSNWGASEWARYTGRYSKITGKEIDDGNFVTYVPHDMEEGEVI